MDQQPAPALPKLLCIFWVLLGWIAALPALGVSVTAVRSGVDAERTRVVFDLSGATGYRVFTLKNPHRVVVDFDAANVRQPLSTDLAAAAVIRDLRFAERGTYGLRMVLDVNEAVTPATLKLPPNGAYGHRLVVDLRAQSSVRPVPGSVTRAQPARLATVPTPATNATADPPALQLPGAAPSVPQEPEMAPAGAGFLSAGLAAGDNLLRRMADAVDLDISGRIGAEGRFFFQDPRLNSQHGVYGSLSFQPEFYGTWSEGTHSLLFVPFARLDQHDQRRTHVDLRELSYIYAPGGWELRAGVRKVFWGVAESNHLVDIINQTDFIENIDFEDKLGQPMVNVALIRDWGTVDLFVLPGFRERTFPGREGRFQAPLHVATSAATYESAAENKHVDFAARYSHYFGAFDVGLYHFWGTTREPQFGVTTISSGEPVFFPFYEIIHQTGADVQATIGNWLWKFEALRRQGQGDGTFTAAVGGFEYTYVGVFETAMDVGVLAEYHWDERGKTAFSPFNDDLFVGSRLAFNDAADSQILGGVISDLNGAGHFLNIEASRRFGDVWKLELELRLLMAVDPINPLFSFRRDDYLQLELLRYF